MEVDPVYLALSKLRKRQFDGCIDICTRLLAENPLDQVRRDGLWCVSLETGGLRLNVTLSPWVPLPFRLCGS
jgi:hypothetical protein